MTEGRHFREIRFTLDSVVEKQVIPDVYSSTGRERMLPCPAIIEHWWGITDFRPLGHCNLRVKSALEQSVGNPALDIRWAIFSALR